MNIVRALEVALPELPERIIRNIPPKLDPKVISKEHIEKGPYIGSLNGSLGDADQ